MIELKNFYLNLDAATAWGIYFQDSATPQMEGLEELHNNIMFYLAIILFAVSWIMISIIINYRNAKISNKYRRYEQEENDNPPIIKIPPIDERYITTTTTKPYLTRWGLLMRDINKKN